MNILERIIGQIDGFVNRLPNRLPLPEIIWWTFAGLIFLAFLWALIRSGGGEVGKFTKSAKRIAACGENFQEAREELNNLPARSNRLYKRSVELNAPASAVMTKDACVTQPFMLSGASRAGAFVRNATIILTALCVLIMAITCEDGCILASFVLFAAGTLLVFGLLLSVLAGAVGRGKQRKGCRAYDKLIDYLEGEYAQFSWGNNASGMTFERTAPAAFNETVMSAVPVYREPQTSDVEDVDDMLATLKREGAEKAEREREAEVEIQRLVAEKAKEERRAAEEAAEKAAAKAAKEKAAKQAALEKAAEKAEADKIAAAEKAAKKAEADRLALEKATEKAAKERAARELAEERAKEAEKAVKVAGKKSAPKKPTEDGKVAVKSPYKKTKSPAEAVPEDIITRINQMDENTSLATMQEVAVLLQEERGKPGNKTPEQQRKLNEALASLLKAMDNAGKK